MRREIYTDICQLTYTATEGVFNLDEVSLERRHRRISEILAQNGERGVRVLILKQDETRENGNLSEFTTPTQLVRVRSTNCRKWSSPSNQNQSIVFFIRGILDELDVGGLERWHHTHPRSFEAGAEALGKTAWMCALGNRSEHGVSDVSHGLKHLYCSERLEFFHRLQHFARLHLTRDYQAQVVWAVVLLVIRYHLFMRCALA